MKKNKWEKKYFNFYKWAIFKENYKYKYINRKKINEKNNVSILIKHQ